MLSGLGDLGSPARGWTQVRCGGSSASSHSTPRGVLLPVLSALPCGAFAIGQQLDGVYTVRIPGPPGGWAQGRGILSVLQSRSKTVSRPDTQSQEKLASVIIVWLNYMLGSSSWAFKIRSLIIFNYDAFFASQAHGHHVQTPLFHHFRRPSPFPASSSRTFCGAGGVWAVPLRQPPAVGWCDRGCLIGSDCCWLVNIDATQLQSFTSQPIMTLVSRHVQKWCSYFLPSWAKHCHGDLRATLRNGFHIVSGKGVQSCHHAAPAAVTQVLSWGLSPYLLPEWQPQWTVVRPLFLSGKTSSKNLKILCLHGQEQHGVLGNSISKPSNFLAAGTLSFYLFPSFLA